MCPKDTFVYNKAFIWITLTSYLRFLNQRAWVIWGWHGNCQWKPLHGNICNYLLAGRCNISVSVCIAWHSKVKKVHCEFFFTSLSVFRNCQLCGCKKNGKCPIIFIKTWCIWVFGPEANVKSLDLVQAENVPVHKKNWPLQCHVIMTVIFLLKKELRKC